MKKISNIKQKQANKTIVDLINDQKTFSREDVIRLLAKSYALGVDHGTYPVDKTELSFMTWLRYHDNLRLSIAEDMTDRAFTGGDQGAFNGWLVAFHNGDKDEFIETVKNLNDDHILTWLDDYSFDELCELWQDTMECHGILYGNMDEDTKPAEIQLDTYYEIIERKVKKLMLNMALNGSDTPSCLNGWLVGIHNKDFSELMDCLDNFGNSELTSLLTIIPFRTLITWYNEQMTSHIVDKCNICKCNICNTPISLLKYDASKKCTLCRDTVLIKK